MMKPRPSSLLRTTTLFHPPPHHHPRPLPSTTAARPSSSTFTTPSQISAYLAHPTWSVRTTLLSPSPTSPGPNTPDPEIPPQKLHHLLRLSALPLPTSPAAETQLLDDLHRQLRFVRAIQGVDTAGVEPLVAIRDETSRGVAEREVGMGDAEIVAALGGERVVGRRGRVVSVVDGEEGGKGKGKGKGKGGGEVDDDEGLGGDEVDDGRGGKWDPLARVGRRRGRYVVVDTARD